MVEGHKRGVSSSAAIGAQSFLGAEFIATQKIFNQKTARFLTGHFFFFAFLLARRDFSLSANRSAVSRSRGIVTGVTFSGFPSSLIASIN